MDSLDRPSAPNFSQSDHDLLIRIAERLESLVMSMGKLEGAMTGKADQRDVAELRERIHELEKQSAKQDSRWWRLVGVATGVAGVVSIAAKFLLGH
jgi:hypothetical protein